jgi:predicted nucleotidyltransferase
MDLKPVLQSFTNRDELYPKFWNGDKLNPQVRKILLNVASKFIGDWKLPKKIKIHDIRLTGSMAAYNWSKYSDLDLHVIVDFGELNKDTELVERFFHLMKSNWNDKHNIDIGGHEIEVYVEDDNEGHIATGLYSVMDDKWVKKPTNTDDSFDEDDVITKFKYYRELYNILQRKFKKGKYGDVVRNINWLKNKIGKMRQSGLEQAGQFSTENLVFKTLRRTKLLDRFDQLLVQATDKTLSDPQSKEVS